MFLGRKTARGLHLFLWGIDFAEEFHSIPAGERIGNFERGQFETWVAAMFNPQQLSLNSFGLAADLAGSDEAGFDLWFEWYDQFGALGRC